MYLLVRVRLLYLQQPLRIIINTLWNDARVTDMKLYVRTYVEPLHDALRSCVRPNDPKDRSRLTVGRATGNTGPPGRSDRPPVREGGCSWCRCAFRTFSRICKSRTRYKHSMVIDTRSRDCFRITWHL